MGKVRGICSIEGCARPHWALSWCKNHWYAARVHGDPLWKPSIEDSFWKRVDKNGPVPSHVPHLGRCWLWTGGRKPHGYGVFYAAKMYAHRWSYQHLVGPIPPDKPNVLHRCDNPRCVRPSHLFVGTQQDNSDDKYEKGRARPNGVSMLQLQPCGTVAAHLRHKRHGEEPCEACKLAVRAARRERYARRKVAR